MSCAERPIGDPHLMGRGPARPIKFRDDGPQPGPAHPFRSFQTMGGGPAHRISGCWAVARPGPSHHRSFTARPGLVHHFPKILDAARPGPSHVQNTRPMTNPDENASSAYTHVPISAGQHIIGRPMSTGRPMKIVGPVHIEHVSHRPPCHVMGRSAHDKP